MRLMIKLPNNGYLYKPVEQLQTSKTNITHHKSSFYSRLAQSEVDEQFLSMWKFASDLFGDTDFKVRVLYSFLDERIDINIFHDSRPLEIEITFEPWPQEEEFTDLWKPNFTIKAISK